MIELKLKELSDIVGGRVVVRENIQERTIKSIFIDSRSPVKGNNSAFFALIGTRHDGHKYIPELIEKGISTFVISNGESVTSDAEFIIVENVLAALQKLAAHIRKKYSYPVVGITGSNGKTVIKEWLHELLSSTFRMVRSPKSFNSQVGVPLSVLLMAPEFNLAVFEAGISCPGEMEKLADIIDPHIGIFSNIGDAHQENFSSIKEKTAEKLRLFEKSGMLIYRADSGPLSDQIEMFCTQHKIESMDWSVDNDKGRIRFFTYPGDGFTKVRVKGEQLEYTYSIPFSDPSAIENSCHCFCLSLALMKEPENILPRFEKLEPVEMRLEIKEGINHCLLVNDFYNSDLHSLSIALSVLNQQAAKGKLEKRIILSDIQQTGIPGEQLYRKVNELLTEWKIDHLTGVGPDLSAHADCFTLEKQFFPSTEQFLDRFSRNDYNNLAILIKGARQFAFERISSVLQRKAHQTELEINLTHLVHNLNLYKDMLRPRTKTMVMVKAFSYGSGDTEIAKMLQYQQVDYLAVAIADEGVELRNAGIKTAIIVMNPEQESFQNMIDYNLEPNLYSLELLKKFTAIAGKNGITDFPVHIKIDTGMNRLGLKSREEILEAAGILLSSGSLKAASVFSHLAASDDPSLDNFTLGQIDRFISMAGIIINSLPYPVDRHILNSAGIERFGQFQFEMVRLGIGLYGVSASGMMLKNTGTLKSTLSQVKKVSGDETIGYGRRGNMQEGGTVAIVPLGYADGLDRKLGNGNGEAWLNGKRVPIIGNVCMDMLMLDVTGVDAKVGDRVEFFGQHISILEMARKAGTIPYEILTGISQRVKRVYYQE